MYSLNSISHSAIMREKNRSPKKCIANLPLQGGKDGHPFATDRDTYDGRIAFPGNAVRRSRLDSREKMDALKRLSRAETAPEIF